MLRRSLCFCLVFFTLFVGCGSNTAPSSASAVPSEPSSVSTPAPASLPEGAFPWEELRDMAGQQLTIQSDSIQGLTLSYALAWTPDQEGYLTLRRNDTLGRFTVVDAGSSYFVPYYGPFANRLACNQSHYTVTTEEPLSGVLQIAESALLFYPYPEPDCIFPWVMYRDKDTERIYAEYGSFTTLQGETISVQPDGFSLYRMEDQLLATLPPAQGDGPRWYDAAFLFPEITVHSRTDSIEEAIYGNVFWFSDCSSFTIGEELFFDEVKYKLWIEPPNVEL